MYVVKLLEWKDGIGWVAVALAVWLIPGAIRRRHAEKRAKRFSDYSENEEKITEYMLKHGGKPPKKGWRRFL
jgi:hypothetical protein